MSDLPRILLPTSHSHGELRGNQVQPAALAQLAYVAGPKWQDARELIRAVAICLAESLGFDQAYCSNFSDQGDEISRDCGLWEINIPARFIGHAAELQLYDHKVNAAAAYALYDRRGWEPWVSFNTGVYANDGYLLRAAVGVMNFLGADLSVEQKHATVLRQPLISIVDLRTLYPHLGL